MSQIRWDELEPNGANTTLSVPISVRAWDTCYTWRAELRLVGYPSVILRPDLTGDKLHGPRELNPHSKAS
jgi:hypothetical protein